MAPSDGSMTHTLDKTLNDVWDEYAPVSISTQTAKPSQVQDTSWEPNQPALPDDGAKIVRRVGFGAHGSAWLFKYLGSLEVRKYVDVGKGSDSMAFREAVHSRRVEHKNVVRVYDVRKAKPDDHSDSTYILRMDYIPGKDLSRSVKEDGVFSLNQSTISLLCQILDALECAHEQGVLHLDLKPSNLLLRKDRSEVLLTDFGISDSAGPGDHRVGGIKGTPFFMAPEQTRGEKDLGPAADLWGFGVTVYFLLSGRFPFAFGNKSLASLFKIIQQDEPIPLTKVAPWVPKRFWELLSGLLIKDPTKRYGSAKEIRQRLERYWASIECSACGEVHVVGESQKDCANPKCSQGSLPDSQAVTQTLREAASAFSKCDFETAQELCLELKQREGAGNEHARSEASRLHKRTEEWQAQHAEAIANVHAALDSGQLVNSFHKALEASRSFSHSKPLRDLLGQTVEAIQKHYEATDAEVEARIVNTDFESAHEYLDVSDQLRDDARVRRFVFGREAPEDSGFGYLHRRVESSERTFTDIQGRIGLSIEKLDFTSAHNALNELQNLFPSVANRDRIQALKEAERTMVFLAEYDDELIDEVSLRGRIPNGRMLQLYKASKSARSLIEEFSPAQYPSLRKILELHEKLEEACRSVRERVDEWVGNAKEKSKLFAYAESKELLDTVADLVFLTDVMPAKFQQEFRQRRIECTTHIDESEQAYKAGIELEADRHYRRAIMEFERAQQLAPHQNLDIPQHLETCRSKADRCTTLLYECENLFERIMDPPPHLRDLLAYLEKSKNLIELADAESSETLLTSLADGVETWFLHETQLLIDEQASSADNFIAVLPQIANSLSSELWKRILQAHESARRSIAKACLCAFGEHSLAETTPESQATHTELIDRFTSSLAESKALTVHLDSGHSNPCEWIAAHIESIVKSQRLYGRNSASQSIDHALSQIDELASACGSQSARQLRRTQAALKTWAQTNAAFLRVRKLGQRARPFLLPAGAAVVGFLLNSALGPWREANARETSALAAIRPLDAFASPEAQDAVLGQLDDDRFYSSFLDSTLENLLAEKDFRTRVVLTEQLHRKWAGLFENHPEALQSLSAEISAQLQTVASEWFVNLVAASIEPCNSLNRSASRGHESLHDIIKLCATELSASAASEPVRTIATQLGTLSATLGQAEQLLIDLEVWFPESEVEDPWPRIETFRAELLAPSPDLHNQRLAIRELFDNEVANRLFRKIDSVFNLSNASEDPLPLARGPLNKLSIIDEGSNLRLSNTSSKDWMPLVMSALGH